MFDFAILMDDYNSGKRAFSRVNLTADIKLYGALTDEHVYLILQKVVLFAKGDYDYELGRLLKYRDIIIRARLN